mmetsp:Transcript_26961/g.56490  ORF Transcript_26961/g.56490 Transcript_26961/m.56490 type:complete len:85 (+) Transcript_26961:705-959(+)
MQPTDNEQTNERNEWMGRNSSTPLHSTHSVPPKKNKDEKHRAVRDSIVLQQLQLQSLPCYRIILVRTIVIDPDRRRRCCCCFPR